jgi:hypothetical protein
MNYHKAGKRWTKAEIDREINEEFSAPILHQTNQGPTYFTKVGDIELCSPEWLIEGLLESGCLIGLVGSSGTGKSFLALDMGCSIASGSPFHERPVKSGKVLYVAGEGQRGITTRIEAWCGARGLEKSDLEIHISRRAILMHDDTEVRAVVSEANHLKDVRLIVIDTLARSFSGYNENSTQDMNHFIANCDLLKSEERSVMIVHHTGHSGDRARGNSAFYAALDGEMSLKKTGNDMTLSCTKMKDAPDFDDLNFQLTPFDLDVDGTEFQSCYLQEVVKSERPPQLKDNPKLALDTLISGTKDNVPQGSLHLEEWRRLFYAGHTGDNEDTKKKAFYRARKSLVDKGFVEVTDDIYSIKDRGT